MPTKAHPEPLRGSLSSDAAVAARQWEVLQFLWAKHPEWRTQALASFRRNRVKARLDATAIADALAVAGARHPPGQCPPRRDGLRRAPRLVRRTPRSP